MIDKLLDNNYWPNLEVRTLPLIKVNKEILSLIQNQTIKSPHVVFVELVLSTKNSKKIVLETNDLSEKHEALLNWAHGELDGFKKVLLSKILNQTSLALSRKQITREIADDLMESIKENSNLEELFVLLSKMEYGNYFVVGGDI